MFLYPIHHLPISTFVIIFPWAESRTTSATQLQFQRGPSNYTAFSPAYRAMTLTCSSKRACPERVDPNMLGRFCLWSFLLWRMPGLEEQLGLPLGVLVPGVAPQFLKTPVILLLCFLQKSLVWHCPVTNSIYFSIGNTAQDEKAISDTCQAVTILSGCMTKNGLHGVDSWRVC